MKYTVSRTFDDGPTHFTWLVEIPAGRKRFDIVLVMGVAGEAAASHVQAAAERMGGSGATEAWVVSNRRISQAAFNASGPDGSYRDVRCLTFDDLIDQETDFPAYLAWLDTEVAHRGIDRRYVELGCKKDEFDSASGEQTAVSRYHWEVDGGLGHYVRTWLEDTSEEQLSILGEFGTGKSWFALRFAWETANEWRLARKLGKPRPRLPLYISLRDYTKRSTVEAMFAQFFFVEHEVLPGWAAFQELNQRGRLLLIFDGFDEMAARVDHDTMMKQFAELSRVVHPDSKVILTSRTEYFPNAQAAREILEQAYLAADNLGSVATLPVADPPRFEIVEIEPFDDSQIDLLLEDLDENVRADISQPAVRDLLRRPVLFELVLEALPDIKGDGEIDAAHVYMFAIKRKMDRDIREERTFTSRADKVLFLTEISIEMIQRGVLQLNYRDFTPRIRQYFGSRLGTTPAELDYWQHDMRSQSMLVRDSTGDYRPSHKSLCEFFVAYRLAGEIGALSETYLGMLGDDQVDLISTTWSSYFQSAEASHGQVPSSGFAQEDVAVLGRSLGSIDFDWTIFQFLREILANYSATRPKLEAALRATVGEEPSLVNKVGGNALSLLRLITPWSDTPTMPSLAGTVLLGANPNHDMQTISRLADLDLQGADLRGVNLQWADPRGADLTGVKLSDLSVIGGGNLVDGACFLDIDTIVTKHDEEIRLWSAELSSFESFAFKDLPWGTLFRSRPGLVFLSHKRHLIAVVAEQSGHRVQEVANVNWRIASAGTWDGLDVLLSYNRREGERFVDVTGFDALRLEMEDQLISVALPRDCNDINLVGGVLLANISHDGGSLRLAEYHTASGEWIESLKIHSAAKQYNITEDSSVIIKVSDLDRDLRARFTSRSMSASEDAALIVVSNDSNIRAVYIDSESARLVFSVGLASDVRQFDCSPDGRLVVVLTDLGELSVHEIATGQVIGYQVLNDKVAGTRISRQCGLAHAQLELLQAAGAILV